MIYDRKIHIPVFFALCLLFVGGCKSKKSSVNADELTQITIEKTPCFGQCPVYSITFAKESNYAEFIGKVHTEKQGKYKKQLTDEELSWVFNTFSTQEWLAFDTLYPTAYSDLPSTIIHIKYGKNQAQTITIKEGGPVNLIQYINRVNELAIKSGGWINLNLE